MSDATAQASKALALAYFEAFSNDRFDEAIALTTDDFRLTGRGKLANTHSMTRDEALAAFRAMKKIWASPFRIIVQQAIAEGDKVAIQATSDATLSDGFRYSNNYVFIVSVRDGRICGIEEYACTVTMVEHINSRRGGTIAQAATLLS